MDPEVKIITLPYLAAQQTRFNAATENFGQTYARGQNQFSSFGRNILARIGGRPTPFEQIQESISNLTEARLNLAEARARQMAQTAPNDADYRMRLANYFAGEYQVTGRAIVTAIQAENSNLGILDNIYRGNSTYNGAQLRFFVGVALSLASGDSNWIQGPNAVTAGEISTFLFATGGMDIARNLFLSLFPRSGRNLPMASTTTLIRKQASIREGQITGDNPDESPALDGLLVERLALETLEQLQLDGITRPDLTNPTNYADILRQRTSLRTRIARFADLPELTRSRNIARRSRLTRTLLTAALAAGIIFSHAQRPESCGTRTFPTPDNFMQQATGGATNISSWRGVAENEWFKRVFGRNFDGTNLQDQISYQIAYNYDPEGNNKLIEQIVQQLKKKNPEIKSAGRDFLIHGTFNEICNGELDQIFDAATPTR